MIFGLLVWMVIAIFLLNCGFYRVGYSMLFPITAPFLLLDWCYKKWHGQSTDDPLLK